MIVRKCDRCGADAIDPQLFAVQKSFVVPVSDPATNTPVADVEMQISITISKDVCETCCASALYDYAVALLGAKIVSPQLKALAKSADAAVKAGK